jgi:hypothetical protein
MFQPDKPKRSLTAETLRILGFFLFGGKYFLTAFCTFAELAGCTIVDSAYDRPCE